MRNSLELLLVALGVSLSTLAVRRARAPNEVTVPVPVPPLSPRAARDTGWSLHSDAAAMVASRNPFRLNRLPALIRVGQPLSNAPSPRDARTAPVRPQLTVSGIVGGPPWAALVEGLPQTQGAMLVREGAHHGELTVTSISRDTVVISARDTVWRLTIKRSVP